jgi:Xaa-Pro aminopeptidase
MNNRFNNIDSIISQNSADGFIIFDSVDDKNQYYLSEFECHNDFLFFRSSHEESMLLVPNLEENRAKEESFIDNIYSNSEYVEGDVRGGESEVNAIIKFLKDRNVQKLIVQNSIEYKLYNKLDNYFELVIVEDCVKENRKVKSKNELNHIKHVQNISEKGLKYLKRILEESKVENNSLYYKGTLVTSEFLKKKAKKFFVEHNCILENSIIVCGKDGSNPHNYGSGEIKPNKPILIDLFPKDENNKYWGDITRTFVKGEPSDEIIKMYNSTMEAFNSCLELIDKKDEVTCEEVHNKACDIYSKHGYKTIRDGNVEEGFIHSTGHSIGLDLHEPPRISNNTSILKENYILTIEPGLYSKRHGAVRIEDMIRITSDGYKKLNDVSYDLRLR